jgi:hypothetical protein
MTDLVAIDTTMTLKEPRRSVTEFFVQSFVLRE